MDLGAIRHRSFLAVHEQTGAFDPPFRDAAARHRCGTAILIQSDRALNRAPDRSNATLTRAGLSKSRAVTGSLAGIVRDHVPLRRGLPMPSYRCYFLDGHDHISGTEVVEADALGAAIEQALAVLSDIPQNRSFEVWESDKRICAFSLDRSGFGKQL
jgi:hypothetical protein